MPTWDELGVGNGVPVGERLEPGSRVESSERFCILCTEAAMGGKEGEKREGGRLTDEGGSKWRFLYQRGPFGL